MVNHKRYFITNFEAGVGQILVSGHNFGSSCLASIKHIQTVMKPDV